MREAGARWNDIAITLGASRSYVIGKAFRMGLLGVRNMGPRPEPPPATVSAHREPLPAGHPIAWSLITAGTTLAAEPYPLPVRTELQRSWHGPWTLGAR